MCMCIYVYSAKNQFIRLTYCYFSNSCTCVCDRRRGTVTRDRMHVTRLEARSVRGCSQGCRKALPVASRELHRAVVDPVKRARRCLCKVVLLRFVLIDDQVDATKRTYGMHWSTLTRDVAI